jgi:TRAP transporter 4TM/12TM fusion protein
MSQAGTQAKAVDDPSLQIDEEAIRRAIEKDNPTVAYERLPLFDRRIIYAAGVIFALFQLWTATFNPLSSMVVRSVHTGFLLGMTFLLIGISDQRTRHRVPLYDYGLAVLGFVIGLYHWLYEGALIERSGQPTDLDLVVGALNILLVAEAARRVMGWGLPVFCLAFIPYAMVGPWLPGLLAHRGYGPDQIIDQLQFSTEGIYGTPIFVSSTFIFLFILFGSFLERAGVIKLFTDLSLGLVGRSKGGPAKVTVVASGLMGMVNGSGVANVLTTGQFSIPLMKRFGYRPAFAGAMEATASMGGQIMPPVMGAAAFIMAETIGVSYLEVCKAAAIPAFLYFASVFWIAHLEAGRSRLLGLPADECPSALKAVIKGWHLLLPLAALVYLLLAGFTPLFAGVIGIAGTVILMLATALIDGRPLVMRIVFWVLLGLVTYGLSKAGFRTEHFAMALVGGLTVIVLFSRNGLKVVRMLVDSLADGARAAVSVGIACALVGILLGVLSLTGLASGLAGIIVDLSNGNLLIALLLTMVACIVLGTGLPTTANYIITASIAAPALLQMGVPLMVSHMFCFYFGIMADLTPPVALAALAASPIARAGHMEISWLATRIGAAGYLVPFIAVFDPALMLQSGTWLDTLYVFAKAAVGIGLWGAAMIGFFFTDLGVRARIFAGLTASLLILALPVTEAIGFVAAAAFVAWQLIEERKLKSAAVRT